MYILKKFNSKLQRHAPFQADNKMPVDTINAGILITALLLFIYACKILIEDARQGCYITMGAEMYFSQLWTIASLLTVIGGIRLFALSWWLFLPGFVVLYCLSLPLRRAISHIFLGLDYEAPKKQGFKEFEKSINNDEP